MKIKGLSSISEFLDKRKNGDNEESVTVTGSSSELSKLEYSLITEYDVKISYDNDSMTITYKSYYKKRFVQFLREAIKGTDIKWG